MTFKKEPTLAKILPRIAAGVPLEEICREEGMPSSETVRSWFRADDSLDQRYRQARIDGFDAIAEECLAIADDGTNDYTSGKNGPVLDAEHVQRSKLRIWTRLELLKKWDPKRYGERVELNHSGAIQTIPDEQLESRLAQLLGKAGAGEPARGKGPADSA